MNKPVAWMCKSGLEYQQVKEDFSYKEKEGWIPLYTHPAPTKVKFASDSCESGWIYLENAHPVKELNEEFEKGFKAGKEEGWKAHKFHHPAELTDEEIWELHQEHIDEVTCGHSMKTVGFIEFARAILRKASEK